MTRTDRLILICASLLVALLYVLLWQASEPARLAQITTQDGSLEPISLNDDREFSLIGPLGESRLEIHNGRLRFLQSPCPNQACVHTGWLQQAGDFAACLPNRISITLVGDGMRFDAINF